MGLSEYQYNQLDKYFSGQMDTEEKKLFLSKIAANEEWQHEFELQKTLRGKQDIYRQLPELFNAVDKESEQYKKDRERLNKIKQLAEPKEEKKKEAMPVRNINYRQWLVAASVLAFIMLAGALAYYLSRTNAVQMVKKTKQLPGDTNRNQQKNDSLLIKIPGTAYLAYQKFYAPYQPGDDIPVELQNAVAGYKEKNYREAEAAFSAISGTRGGNLKEQKPLEVSIEFYKGLCFLALNQGNDAYKILSKAYLNRQNVKGINEDISWYYALACLKTNQKAEAVLVLTGIPAASKKYAAKAGELLKSIEKPLP